MKIMTVLGTRPEIIRLSRVIDLLDRHTEQVLVHTGQNYDEKLDRIFFDELGVRTPDVNLGARGSSFAEQAGQILLGCERLFLEHRPERLLILGDTNSGLSAIVARRLGIPVYHMEAGNRCFDDRVPEEVNRRLIDHSSSVLMPYTNRSRDNLIREGIAHDRIYVTGNPIRQVIEHYRAGIDASDVLARLGLTEGKYFLATFHRAENVDREDRLRQLVDAMQRLAAEFDLPVVCSVHPRTRSRMEKFGLDPKGGRVRFMEPLGFLDFVRLERSAFCLVSDSGTVQEEGSILGVRSVTIRETTERPETIECGSNILAGTHPDDVLRAVTVTTTDTRPWSPPAEYMVLNVAETVVRIVTGFRRPDAAETEWLEAARL